MGNLTPSQQSMVEVFQQHMNAEMAGDLEGTMATMTDAPHLHNIPVKMGGVGREGVRQFYANHLIGKFFPPDVEFINVSRTIGEEQLVEENVIKFTHTMTMDWMLPEVPPTGRRVEVAVVVIVKFENGKVAHEHIYWDQASVLVQLGLLDPSGLPVSGSDSARKILDPNLSTHDM
ncbi:MAG: nuclear transport factor 2 family protein [Nitrospirae bacterium]|nr:nuclear transport factor 2 family protein [Nitrospirota bacterium]MDA1303280.1 nuclear transport factor 2 family protein [Nitrospirota bacterium]